jgi:hypothetical protein
MAEQSSYALDLEGLGSPVSLISSRSSSRTSVNSDTSVKSVKSITSVDSGISDNMYSSTSDISVKTDSSTSSNRADYYIDSPVTSVSRVSSPTSDDGKRRSMRPRQIISNSYTQEAEVMSDYSSEDDDTPKTVKEKVGFITNSRIT